MKGDSPQARSEATLLDRGYQLAYVCAYQLMRVYWKVRRPTTHGTLIVLWNAGELLLVRNSYVSYYCVPGGYRHRGESGPDAAIRELREEVGIDVRPDQLQLAIEETNDWQGKRDHVQIFSVDVAERPTIAIDHREVIEASWWTPERALSVTLYPPLRRVIEQRVGSRPGG